MSKTCHPAGVRDSFSYGTVREVQLGDKVLITRWLRGPLNATVCYLPELSPPHPAPEDKRAMRTDDGTVRAMGYSPESPYGQPSKGVTFLERSEDRGIGPDEPLL